MNILQLSAITVVILASISESVFGAPPPPPNWSGRKTKEPSTPSTPYLLPSTLESTPSSTKSKPIEAALKTSSLALETTTMVPPRPSPTIPPMDETKAPVELSTEPPLAETKASTELPLAESSIAPEIAASPSSPRAPEVTKPSKPKTPAPTLPPVDFDCKQKADGNYADPKNKCSSKYYACVGGLARQLECAASDLVFEPETEMCERRQESFRCTGTRKTTLATTPRRPAPTPVKLPIDCAQKDDGWFPDPQKKCSHVFYSCSNGAGARFECPGNMYFDVETSSCEAFQDVMACAGKRPSKKPITTTKPPVTEKLPIDCTDKPSGQYADPTKKCSAIYFVCSNGDAIKRSCPDGLYYDAKSQLCDYFDEIFDCTGRTKPPTPKPTVAPKPKPSEASLPSTEYNCSGKADGSFTPEDKKCSDIYYRCVAGVAYKLKCPEDLYYDVENDLCDRWMDLFVCSGKKPTSPLPVTTTKPKPTEKLPIDCSKYEDGDFADPEKKCSRVYYSCSNYLGSRRQCPEGLYFDKESRICDVLINIPDCSGKPRPLTTLPPTKRPDRITRPPYNCEKNLDGNYAGGKCVDYYWACVGGSAARASCPHGTYYDSELDQCGYKEEIPACGGVRPTEKP